MKAGCLDDICQMVTDGTHYTPKDIGAGIPFLTVKDMRPEGLDFAGCSYISEADFQAANAGNSAPKRGDVLFSKDGTVGKVHVVSDEQDFAVLSSIAILRPDTSQVDSQYLGQMLRTPKVLEQATDRKTGSAIRRIILSDLRKLRVSLPSLEEQRRIAAILDQAEALRTKRRQALVKLDTLTQSLFLEMFGDLTREHNFDVLPLGRICDVRDGTHTSPVFHDSGYPLVTSKNLRDGKVDLEDVKYISESDYLDINRRSKVHMGDILMPMIGTVGNPVLVTSEPRYAVKNVAIIKFSHGSPSRRFIHTLLDGPYFDHVTRQKSRGGTQRFLALGDTRSLPIPIPSRELQDRFEQRAVAISEERLRIVESSTSISILVSSLQHRAFRGEL